MLASPRDVVLRFRLQEDGRRVARLPSGKVVLVALDDVDRVKDGEWWRVHIDDHPTFAIARLVAPSSEPEARMQVVVPPQVVKTTAQTQPKTVANLFPALAAGQALPEPDEVLGKHDRVALFVDSANIAAAREMGFFVDWRKAKEYFTESARFYAAFFYVGVESQESFTPQTAFLEFLAHSGYVVRTKPVKRIIDRETGEERFKANLDLEMALDMMDTLGNWDVAFLFTGDGDFARAVELLRTRGKRVYIVAPKASLARELVLVADKPIFFLDNYRSVLAREDRAPKG